MPKFILIEQSLRSLGGHHFEYAVEILRAAEASGYQPVLATNRDFSEFNRFPRNWQVAAVFPFRSDRIHRVPKAASQQVFRRVCHPTATLGNRVACVNDAFADLFKTRISGMRWRRRRIRVTRFADACRELFQQICLEPGDQVYCSTVSDMDLLGLGRFLECQPDSENADWHLQFHFGVFSGRDPQYAKQARNVRRLKRRFQETIVRLPQHNIFFYTTTDELRRQFDRLNAIKFQTLPWPVSDQFYVDPIVHEDGSRVAAGSKLLDCGSSQNGKLEAYPTPLRMVCAGGVRREKGGELIGPLVRSLEHEFLRSNKVQLLLQTGQKRKSRSMLGLAPENVSSIESYDRGKLPASPIVALPHPLSPEDYARLIRDADVGLLLYDSDEYFARCSGILVELFAAAVPVIGPAGCWLGEQIAAANQKYLSGLLDHSTVVTHWNLLRQPKESVGAVDLIRFGGAMNQPKGASPRFFRHSRTSEPGASAHRLIQSTVRKRQAKRRVLDLAVEQTAADLLLRLAPSPSAALGEFARIRLEQFALDGRKTADLATIEGAAIDTSRDASSITTLFHMESDTARIRLSLENAYQDAPAPLIPCDAFLINDANGELRQQPMGAAGLTFASPEFIPQVIRDVVAHHDHYRQATEEFAIHWREKHAPVRTVETIVSNSQATRRSMLRPTG